MLMTGVMECQDEYELDMILNKLKCVRNALVTTRGLTVTVDYIPSDNETEFEEEETVARLTDIIESVEVHGLSVAQ